MSPLKVKGFAAILVILAACSGEEAAKKQTNKTAEPVPIKAVPASSEPVTPVQAIKGKTDAIEAIEETAEQAADKTESASVVFDRQQVRESYAGMEVKVLDISERSHDGGNAIAVTLSVPLDPAENHDDYFSVSQNNVGNVEGGWVLSESGKIAYFPYAEPSSSYTVQVYKGLKAANGEKLSNTASQDVATRAIQASYSFASKGSFLPLEGQTGLPVVIINTPEVNVDYFRVRDDRITQFLSMSGDFSDQVDRYQANHSVKEGDLVYSARYQFDAPKNKRREYNLPTHMLDALQQPGVYVAVMSLPGDYQQAIRMTYFTVTDIGLHARVYDRQTDVFLSSLKTGEPLKGVEVQLIDRNGQLVQSSKSTPDGLATFGYTRTEDSYLIARNDSSVTIVPFRGPALDLSDFDLGNRPFKPQELFIYGPRDLYRPGETAWFSALLRNHDGKATHETPLRGVIKSPDGQTAKSLTLYAKDLGYYEADFAIPQDAKTGEWRFEVNNAGNTATVYRFKVEEFLPERMKLTFNPGIEKRFYSSREPLVVRVLGEYLYGAPASGNRFESRILMRPEREPFEALKGYQFGDVKDTSLKQEYTLADIKLDASGQADVSIESRWGNTRSPVAVTLLGSLFETGGRPVTRRHITTIWPTKNMVGIRPEFGDKNPSQNSRVKFEVISADAQGGLHAASDLEATLVREDRRYFWEYSRNQGWHYEWSDREYPEYTTAVSTEAGKAASLEVSVEYGWYRLEVRDPQTGTLSSVRFHAGRDWYYWWRHNQSADQAARPDKVSLAWDKESYLAGEEATLSIVPPAAGEAIVLVESDQPLFMQRVSVPAQGVKLKIPVDKSWDRHDLYASVVLLQKTDSQQKITPKRAFGLLHLPLNRESRKLNISFDIDERIYPNQKYETRVKIDGQANNKTHLTLAMVDVGVLSITDFETPEPHKFFFEQRRYQVDSRDMYHKLIDINDNPAAKQKFGGDAALSRGGKEAQAEVQIVSLYSGLVDVDANGEAKVTFEIPDFNGRVRFMAVAFTDDSFGSAEQEMTIAAPLVTQIAMPRFLAMGDESTFALDIHNLSEAEQTLAVDLKIGFPVSTTEKQQTLTLAKGEKTTLLYPVSTAYQTGRSQIDLMVTGLKNYQVNRSWGIQVRPAHPAVTNNRRAIVKPGESFEFTASDIEGLIPETLEAVLSVNNSVDLKLRDQMDSLLSYPYGCLEQSTSSTYPWLFATPENLAKMGIKNKTQKTRQQSLEHGLDRIQSKMLKSGGFGLWSNTSDEQHWLTSYVGDFLTDAKQEGVKVNDELYNNTMKRLDDYVRNRNGIYANRWSAYADHYDLAYRAYAGYVLSRHNKAHLGSLREMASNKLQYSRSFLPLIHLGLALINQGDNQAGQDMLDKALTIERSDEYYADYGSPIRDRALAIHLLIRHQQKQEQVAELSVSLAAAIKQRKYLSTQERNALFLAGLALETRFASEWQADITLKGALETIKNEGTMARKYEGLDLEQGFTLANRGQGDLFVEVDYLGYGKTPPPAESGRNLKIERSYYDVKGNNLDPSQLKVGDLVLVGLRVYTHWRTPDVLVVDLLPAGLELENQNLNHAIKLDEIKFDGQTVSYWMDRTKVIHQEYRDDRYVAAIDADYGNASYLFYLARAVTPGKYNVPAPLVEDMYRAEDRAVGTTVNSIEIVNP